MALFKIFNNIDSQNTTLPSTYTKGYMYYDAKESIFYIDTAGEGGTTGARQKINAWGAEKTLRDSLNQQIDTTYIKGISISNNQLSYTTGDGTSHTVEGTLGAVTGVKGNAESSYRTGDVNLTAANVGAPSTTGTGASGTWGINISGTAANVAWSGVTNKPTTLSGYGITDANIVDGTITLGENSITPLTSHQDISEKADLASPVFTGIPTAPTAANGTNSTQIATTAFVMNAFTANDAMVFKGVLGTESGMIATLPTTHSQGWTYKVGTAGTYAGQVCEVGDTIYCVADGTTANNAHWVILQTNVDGTVIGPAASTADHIATFTGTTGKVIKDSGFTIGTSVPANAVFTDTNKYHKTGSWSGLTYTAQAVNSADELKFTIPSATTSAAGAVQLSSATNSTSETLAATAQAVKTAYDLAASKTSNTGTVTSVAASGSNGITISGSPITTSGTITVGLNLSEAINELEKEESNLSRNDYIISENGNEANGNIVTFETDEELPLKKITVDIEPVQEGSGDPSPGNVRPISGWTGCNIHVSPTTTGGTVYHITFPTEAGTVYGGTLDVTTGKLTSLWGKVYLKTLTYEYNNTVDHTFQTYGYPRQYGAVTIYCDRYEVASSTTVAVLDYSIACSTANNTVTYLRDIRASTITELMQLLESENSYIVYPLREPEVYQLTPQEITTLLGSNNIWADCGDIDVIYTDNNSIYKRKKIGSIFSTLNSEDITNALGYTPYNSSKLGTIGTTDKLYAVGVDANGELAVNVPWINTTYTFDGTYNALTNKAATVSTVTNAINNLGVSNIFALQNHIHGNISHDGKLKINNENAVNKVVITNSTGDIVASNNSVDELAGIRVYRRTVGHNYDYPLLVSDTLASNLAAGNGEYTDGVYSAITNNLTTPTVNLSTGLMKAPGGFAIGETSYGEVLPDSGVEGQLFFQLSNPYYELPAGGTSGQVLMKSSNNDREVSWGSIGKMIPNNINKYYITGSTNINENSDPAIFNTSVYVENSVLFGAAWNDYAEYRKNNEKEMDIQKPGKCVKENGDGTLSITTKRLERGCEIISDTFGFAIGQDKESGYNTPIASSGRVLVYPYESIEDFKSHIGYPVCSGPNGTVSIMIDEEEKKYPSRIIGTISEIPNYDEWGTGKIKVDGRIWIRIK